jgi:hypothetical protein
LAHHTDQPTRGTLSTTLAELIVYDRAAGPAAGGTVTSPAACRRWQDGVQAPRTLTARPDGWRRSVLSSALCTEGADRLAEAIPRADMANYREDGPGSKVNLALCAGSGFSRRCRRKR